MTQSVEITNPSGTPTHCPYCAFQCAMTLSPAEGGVGKDGAPVEVSPREFPTNRGGLCRKGWTSSALLGVDGRIQQPLVRGANGEFEATSWETVLDLIATQIKKTQDQHGLDAVGVFGGGGLTNEKAYQLGKFARLALKTSRIDYNGRFCMASAAAASNRAFGIDRGLPFPVTDLDDAYTMLILGSNMADTMPPILSHFEGVRNNGGLIVVDPRLSSTAKLTQEGKGIHVQPAAGTDLAFLLALINVVISERLYDTEYVANRTNGFAKLRTSVAAWWPERAQSVTGVPAEQIRAVARRLASGKQTFILTGRGVEQHVFGTDTATAAINLALILGLPGRPGSGYGTMTGQGNGQGGREHGQKCDQLPGYRKIDDPAAREYVASVWGVDPAIIPGPGLPAVQLLSGLGTPGGVRMLFVHGANMVVSAPNADAVRAAIGRLDIMVVCDFFLSETAKLADIVLPVLQWAEEEGTMTNLEGRIIRRKKALNPPPGARSELWVMAELAKQLQAPGVYETDPKLVFDELALASKGGISDYSGLSHELLDTGVAAYWPYPEGSTGTPNLFREKFAHQDGKAKLVAVRYQEPEKPMNPGEITLITGRLLEHYQSGAQTRRVPELAEAQPFMRAQIHPATVLAHNLSDGQKVELTNHRGRVEAVVESTTDIRIDTVFLPFHFSAQHRANILTNDATDPISAMPEFKTAIVRLKPLE